MIISEKTVNKHLKQNDSAMTIHFCSEPVRYQKVQQEAMVQRLLRLSVQHRGQPVQSGMYPRDVPHLMGMGFDWTDPLRTDGTTLFACKNLSSLKSSDNIP